MGVSFGSVHQSGGNGLAAIQAPKPCILHSTSSLRLFYMYIYIINIMLI